MPQPDHLDAIVAQAKRDRSRLNSGAMGAGSLTALGIASVVGAGIFVTTGAAAAQYAGPAVVFSFLLAGLAAAVTALCYAEMAAMIPAAGSTYSYAYATFGIFLAWFIGWDLLLEYLFAASTVAVGWSGYFDAMLQSIGITLPHSLTNAPFQDDGGVINLPAILIVLLTCGLLWAGTRESAKANNWMVALKLSVLVLFVGFGIFYVTKSNWEPFIPDNTGHFGDFGITGVLRAAGVVFFAYVGFDAVSTAAAEARRPQRTIPIGLMATVGVSTLLYVLIGIVMTGMVDYHRLDVADPIAEAVRAAGPSLGWLESAVSIAAVIGLAATVLVTFYGQTRIFMRMASDGMLPDRLGAVGRFRTPGTATLVCAVAGGLCAGFTPIDVLTNLVSIGTLLSFVIVSGAVLVLRRRRPDLERPFRVPAVNVVAPAGMISAALLIALLPVTTWIRLAVWLLIGLVIFFAYAKPRSTERMARLAAATAAGSDAEPAPAGD
ncbi:amino acid permease [Conexibacter sp. JD483]|uniref:amino acid permease n=1 Tax=unclassified Conexibacter TaxID=2627773 RepID=UPI002719C33F|nr:MULTISPECIES: amino acid permease [unclassified Conexibacter]MDO8188456.1 amino acid permease [Conexibacter sp. CPCC 205706]MDO8199183.1 amino acid permease [Conexibacter sp. CPCC 205762]MDR9371926.1 amino acid permease [Conexibacter sp. JD483]